MKQKKKIIYKNKKSTSKALAIHIYSGLQESVTPISYVTFAFIVQRIFTYFYPFFS